MLSRGEFLAATGAAALLSQTAAAGENANARAARIAANSVFARARLSDIAGIAESVSGSTLKADLYDILRTPIAKYQLRYPTQESRAALRDAFVREGWVAADAPLTGIFPSGILPFIVAPGSAEDSHHAYPGGLCTHEVFNARTSDRFATNYDGIYFGSRAEIDRDLCVAAALYHDIMKTVVFQYNDDGTFTPELEIAGTGGHHVLSGAEAIVRGHDARFVTVLLSAHAAPSLGDEAKVVRWCRAAAMLAGVDPVAFGLVRRTSDGYALAEPPPIECFISHLSDHDYVFTVYAAQVVRPALARAAPHFGVAAGDAAALNWWRLRVCANASTEALYQSLLRGESAFLAAVKNAYDVSS